MPSVTAEEATVRYATSGNGPGLLLVSGTGLDAQTNWSQLAPRFAERHTVVLADYAGSGDTPLADGQLSVDLLAGQMAAVAAAATDQPVDLLGYSLGAMVAATMAATRPELVRRLVLVAGWPGPDDARQELAFDLWRRLERTDHDLFNGFLQLTCLSAPCDLARGINRKDLTHQAPPQPSRPVAPAEPYAGRRRARSVARGDVVALAISTRFKNAVHPDMRQTPVCRIGLTAPESVDQQHEPAVGRP